MLLYFKKSNEILETWSPHCKNLAFKDPPSLNFHNGTDANMDKKRWVGRNFLLSALVFWQTLSKLQCLKNYPKIMRKFTVKS